MEFSFVSGLAIILILGIVVTITWFITGKMRLSLETLLFLAISQLLTIFMVAVIEPSSPGEYAIIALVLAFTLILYGYRFNLLFKEPYNDLLTSQLKIINSKDLNVSQFYIPKNYTGEMMSLYEAEKISIITINEIMTQLKLADGTINSIGRNMSQTTSRMVKEVSEVTNDVDEILQSSVILSETISQIKNNLQMLSSDLTEHFAAIKASLETSNRISDHTNLIAVNAAIEAAHSGSHGKNFAIVAEGIHQLSGRTKKSTEKLYDSTSSINERLNSELTLLMKDIEQIDEYTIQISELSNNASRNSHQYQKNTLRLLELSKNILSSSETTTGLIKDYKV